MLKNISLGLMTASTLFASQFAQAETPIEQACHKESPQLSCSYMNYRLGTLKLTVRVGTQEPKDDKIIGDILYVPGFSDRLDNHGPLFQAWNDAGFRVIAFDLPGHGENKGSANNINLWSFENLARLTAFVEAKTAAERPLILSGWSTGGLVVTRMVQMHKRPALTRKVSGLILYAPGIAVRMPWAIGAKSPDFADGKIGYVTLESLTHDPNPPHNGPILPKSPVTQVAFGAALLANAELSQKEKLPQDLSILIFTGGDKEDLYADEMTLKNWINKSKPKLPLLFSVDCANGRHELDNELAPMGETVQADSAIFAIDVVNGASTTAIDLAKRNCAFSR